MKKLLKYFLPSVVAFFLFALVAVASILSVPQGGTGKGTFPVKSLILSNGTKATGTLTSLAGGTNGYVLSASSTSATGFAWIAQSGGGTPAGRNTQFQINNSGSFGAAELFNNSSLFAIGVNSTTPYATLVVQGTSTQPTLDIFRVASSSNDTYLTVTSAGKVGIGSSSPSATLTVVATGTAVILQNTATDANTVSDSVATSKRIIFRTDRSGTASDVFIFRGRIFTPGNSGVPEISFGAAGGSESSGFLGDGIGKVIGNGGVGIYAANAVRWYCYSTIICGTPSQAGLIGWNSSAATSLNTALGSFSVGTVEINNGTIATSTSLGNLRDLMVRNLSANTTSTSSVLTIQGIAGETRNLLNVSSSTGANLLTVSQNGTLTTGAGITSSGTINGSFASRSFIAASGSAAFPSLSYSGDSTSGVYLLASGKLGLAVSGQNQLTITTTGLGIASTTPSATLAVVGTSTLPTTDLLTVASSTGVSQFKVASNGSTTIANLNVSACDVKSTTDGSLYCGTDATGAGSTPAGSDTQIQFNNAGAFGAKAGFTFNTTTDVTNLPGSLTLIDGGTVQSSGHLYLQSNGDANDLSLYASDAITTSSNGGNTNIFAGAGGSNNGYGGDIVLTAGSGGGGNSNGGYVTLKPGAKTGSGTNGMFQIINPTSLVNANFDTSLLNTDRTFTFPNYTGTFLMASSTTDTFLYGNSTTTGQLQVVGSAILGQASTTAGTLILQNAVNGFTTTLTASSSIAASWTLTLPPTAGLNGQVLITDGAGTTNWADALTVDSSQIVLKDDFPTCSWAGGVAIDSEMEWQASRLGANNGSIAATASTANHPGVCRLATSATGVNDGMQGNQILNGTLYTNWGSTGTFTYWKLDYIFRTVSVSNTAIWAGLMDSASTTSSPVSAIRLKFDPSAAPNSSDTNWVFQSISASTISSSTGSSAFQPTANDWMHFTIQSSTAGTVTYTLTDLTTASSTTWTNSTNVPTTAMGPIIAVTDVTTNAQKILDIDFFSLILKGLTR